jgi:BRCT domain type II-containing protein
MKTNDDDNDDDIQKYGTVVVRSKPSRATVIVNGENRTTPVFIKLDNRELPYDIIIKKEGYFDYTQKVTVQGKKIEINATLEKKGRRRKQHTYNGNLQAEENK